MISLDRASPDTGEAFPSIASGNINSMSITNAGGVKGRFLKVLSYISYLATSHDITCIQDTRFPSNNFVRNLQPFFPNYTICSSADCTNKNSGGVLIFINNKTCKNFTITTNIISEGSAIHVNLAHKVKHFDINMINCYLDASDEARWCNQVEDINNYDLPKNTVMVGDFNHVYHSQDRSGYHDDHSTKAAKLYQDMLTKHGLQQIDQNLHTWYGYRGGPLSSSKVDRAYHNFSYIELSEITPHISLLASAPHTIAQYDRKSSYRDHIDNRVIDHYVKISDGGTHITDHIPLSIRINKKSQNNNKKFHAYTLGHDDFLTNFDRIWSNNVKPHNCFDKLNQYKNTLMATSKIIKKKQSNYQKKDQNLWEAVRLVNELGRTDVNLLKNKYSHLTNYIHLIEDPDALVKEINEDFAAKAFDEKEHLPLSKIQTIAKCLPTKRDHIHHLHDNDCDSITNDPERMTKIIHNFWGDKWEKKHIHNPKKLFETYGKKVKFTPPDIDLHMVMENILNTNDSAAGPDSIPFAAYRKTIDFVAPIILECIHWLMSGRPAPDDFNGGILHLLPKKNTGKVEDTRPLVINNCDNRIIATIIRDAILLPLESILSDNQNGFREGRSTISNLEFFNEKFYRALEHNKFYDILFIDFCKAFDSIAHEAIFALLEQIGIGEKYVCIIKALFHNAYCMTNINNSNPAKINFGSGVKQGCPLSPLLFILITDVLIDMLEEAEVDVKFFADDAGIGDDDITTKLPTLKKIFKTFRKHTGLEMNVSKTVCVATGGRSYLTAALKKVGWSKIKVVDKTKYLGLYIGHGASIDDIFKEPYDKMQDRLKSYESIKSKFSIPKRVLIWNTWILPIFSYVSNFYIMPCDYTSWVDNTCNKWLSNGNKIKSLHLSRPSKLLGLTSPLRDTCNHNYARLASLSSPGIKDPSSPSWSMRFTTHRGNADNHVQNAYGVETANKDSATIYQAIANSNEMTAEYKPYINNKLDKLGLDNQKKNIYMQNYRNMPSWVPCYARYNNISITHNLLPTARRHQEHHECHLCGVGEDSISHLFGDCQVAKNANDKIWGMANVSTNHTFSLPASVGANSHLPSTEMGLQVMLSHAIWRARTNAMWGDNRPAEGWISWIVTDTIDRILSYSPSYFTKHLTNNKFPDRYKIAMKAKLGSSGNKNAATVDVASVTHKHIHTLPIGTHFAFTDGSASPNPGPAGAGATIHIKSTRNDTTNIANLTAALGHATNNAGELYAIGMVTDYCADNNIRGNIHIYTDSKIAHGALCNGWRAGNANKGILFSLRERIHSLRHKLKFIIHWIPGHSGITHNEIADQLANAGTHYSTHNIMGSINIPKNIEQHGFTGLQIDAIDLPT